MQIQKRSTAIWNTISRRSRSLLLIILLALGACIQKDTTHAPDTYTCPMHPTVISDKAGSCPVCGMDLVRKARPGEEIAITEDLTTLINSPNEKVLASIQTIRGEYKTQPVSLQAQGVVTYDTRNLYTISSRVAGRLEKMYFKYPFQPVNKGQKIAEIYSTELVTAQRELLFLLDNDTENKSLIEAAKKKLELLGFSPAQVMQLTQQREPRTNITIYSPYSGYIVTEQTAVPSVTTVSSQASGMSVGMDASDAPAPTNSRIKSNSSSLIREGNYIAAGETLASIVNTDALRVELVLPTTKANAVKKGDSLELDFGNRQAQAFVDFVQPFLDGEQEFIKIRVFVKNSKDLHIGHLVSATIILAQAEGLWVPRESVLDLGEDKIVFMKDRGVFKPKKIKAGISANGSIEIKNGLSSTDEIAANAQYLIDSESFIKPIK